MQPACSVIILAGGKSSRMGTSKAWLEFAERPLLTHLVARMQASFPEVLVVAAPGQELPKSSARVVCDEYPGAGPLAGLAVGLREISYPLAFVSSCDAPFVNVHLIQALLDRCEGFDVVAPEWGGRVHPLHAVYRATLQPQVVQQLEAGQRRVTNLLGRVRTRIVTEAELEGIDPEGRSLINVNTPEEYQRALELWSVSQPPYEVDR